MEFIKTEWFKEQPVYVQKVFIDWWKPQEFDIYAYKEDLKPRRVTETDIEDVYNNELYNVKSRFAVPLFTEGQLRRFIEEKTLGINAIQFKGNKITISIYDNSKPLCFKEYKILGSNLLQAYWEVACKIATSCDMDLKEE